LPLDAEKGFDEKRKNHYKDEFVDLKKLKQMNTDD
jgi:hypothetical protein